MLFLSLVVSLIVFDRLKDLLIFFFCVLFWGLLVCVCARLVDS